MGRGLSATRVLLLVATGAAVLGWHGWRSQPDRHELTIGTQSLRVSAHGEAELFAHPAASSCRLAVTGAARGTDPVPLRPARVTRGGGLRIDRGPFAERWSVAGEGFEHQVELAFAPPGQGPLVLELGVAPPCTPDGSDARGARFRNGRTVAHYGAASWVDATGRSWPLVSRATVNGLQLEVPDALLRAARWPARVDPLVSAEVEIEPPVTTAVGQAANVPTVSWNGSNYLAVWSGYDVASMQGPTLYGLFATRISPTGTVLDEPPLKLNLGLTDFSAINNRGGYAAGANGQSLLVYQTPRANPTVLLATRISGSGAALDGPGGIELRRGAPLGNAAVAVAGSTYLVAWHDSARARVVGQRVGADGQLLGPQFDISPMMSTASTWLPTVTSDGAVFLVSWNSSTQIRAARVARDGTVLDPGSVLINTPASATFDFLASAYDGTRFLVTWHELVGGNTLAVRGARVTPDAGVIDTIPVQLIDDVGLTGLMLGLSGAPTGFLGGWTAGLPDSGVLDSGMVAFNGTTGAAVRTAATWPQHPSLASNGSTHLAVVGTRNNPLLSTPISGQAYDSQAQSVGGRLLLNAGPNGQFWLRAAGDDAGYLATWFDLRSPGEGVYARALGPDGTPVGGAVQVAPTARVLDVMMPDVEFNGTHHLVAWGLFDGGVSGRRYLPGATPVDGAPVTLVNAGATGLAGSRFVRLASDGVGWLAVYEADLPSGGPQVRAQVVNASGLPAGAPLTLSTNAGSEHDVVWDGTSYVVGWTESSGTTSSVYVGRVTANGVLIDPSPVPVATDAIFKNISAGGGQWLVVFQSTSTTSPDVSFERFATDGTRLDATPRTLLTPAPGAMVGGSWVRDRFVLAFDTLTGDLTGIDVWPDGGSSTPQNVGTGTLPRVVPRGDGGLLAYTGVVDRFGRARARTLVFLGDAQSCTQPSDCGSGTCASGVCCSTACAGECPMGVCAQPDAGDPPDAGRTHGPYVVGCGCGASPVAGAWLLGLTWWLRRRRPRRGSKRYRELSGVPASTTAALGGGGGG